MISKKLYSLLKDSSEKFPDKLAVVYKDKKYNYREFQQLASKIKNFLIQKTDVQEVIGMYMENSDFWLATYFGIFWAGCVCCPFDHRIATENIIQKIRFAKPKYLIVSKKYLDRVKREGIGQFTEIILVDNLIESSIDNPIDRNFPNQERSLENAKFSTIMFTSGTTGKQKAIRLPNEIVFNATKNIVDYLKLRHDEVYYAILPFSHSFGIGNVHTTLMVGGSVIIADNTINLKKVLSEIVDYKATFFAATPLTLKLIVENFLEEFITAGETLRVICTNTGPMPPSISKKIIENLKKTYFYTYYGLTEASRSTFYCFNLHPEKIESVGKSTPNVDVSIVDSNLNKVTPLEVGEIFIKGNNVISEYWGDEEKTRDVFVNEGMLTGDIGYHDKDGFLYVVGRKDDLINIGGEKFSLLEVDKTIKELDIVEDVATIVENNNLEGHLKSFVILKTGKLDFNTEFNIDEQKAIIFNHCKNRLENYKTPLSIVFVDSLPKTDSGKLKRKELY